MMALQRLWRSSKHASRGLLLLSCLLAAQKPVAGLELPQVLQELQAYSPPLAEARLKQEQIRGKLLEKQGAFDTKLKSKALGTPLGYYRNLQLDTVVVQPTPWWGASFFSGYRLGVGKFADYDGKKQTLDGGEIRTGLEIPLLRDGEIDSRRAEIASLELQLEIAELEIFQKQLELSQKALKAYWSWLAAIEKVAVAQELLALTQTRVQQLQLEIELGKQPPVSALDNQQALFKRQAKLLELQQEERAQALELSLFLRGARMPVAENTQPFLVSAMGCQMPAQAPAIEAAQRQRPEVLILQLRQAQNALGLRLAQNQLLPDLGLFLSLSQDLGSGPESKVPFEAEAGLQFEWPLQQRKASGQVQQLEAEKGQLQLQFDFSQANLRNQVQQALLELQLACRQIGLTAQESQLAAQLAEAERQRFALGSSSLFVVNQREQAAADARLRLIDAFKAYYLAEGQTYLVRGLLPRARVEAGL